MRIQHNIPAMSAYRNYSNNVSAVAKNLERLSSGYRINRAGDDAAGLAISEKMRAQISGLEQAQTNAKSGINLVQTAEGALTEVHDMLNRMYTLAEQSANGTYDDSVDRVQLQKEVDQLRGEINRIADSANFNGIKLLDGSLEAGKDYTATMDFNPGKDLPGVGLTLGVDTVLHNAVADPTSGSKFSVDLHDYTFNNQKGDKMSIQIGDTTIELTSLDEHKTGDDPKKLTGNELVDMILAGTDRTTNKYAVTVNGKEYKTGENITIQGQEFKIEKADNARINFTQVNPPKTEAEDVDPSMVVKIGGNVAATKAKFSFDTTGLTIAATDKFIIGNEEITAGGTDADALVNAINANSTVFDAKADGSKVILTAKSTGPMEEITVSQKKAASDVTAVAGTTGDAGTQGAYTYTVADTSGDYFELNGTKFEHGSDYSSGQEVVDANGVTWIVSGDIQSGGTLNIKEKGDNQVYAGVAAPTYNKKVGADVTENLTLTGGTASVAAKVQSYKFDVGTWTGGELDIKGVKIAWNGVDAQSSVQAAIDAGKLNFADYNITFSDDGTNKNVVFTAKKAGAAGTGAGKNGSAAAADGDVKIINASDVKVTTVQKGAEAETDPVTGDYNVSTTVIKQVSAADKHRLASTYFDLTEDMVTEGSVLTIAGEKYTFTADDSKIGNAGYVDISSGDLNTIAQKLTDAAKQNKVYTVGHDGKRISVTETLAHDKEYKVVGEKVTAPMDGYDLRTAEGIAKSLSFTSGTTRTRSGLTLQIGDTAESFNQLTVSVKDMHTEAMGIGDIDISKQNSASDAVAKIKDAINYVSDVRGSLGATQNRLDHTINNLSVMQENIQDAESTIRDVDVAKEMMAYTKNNILVQSAQAMLAQANQLPQGVLQLLG